MLRRKSPGSEHAWNVSVDQAVNLHSARMWEPPMRPSKILPFAAAFLLTLSGLAVAQMSGGTGGGSGAGAGGASSTGAGSGGTGGGSGAGAGGASSTGAGIGASGLTGSNARAIASPPAGAGITTGTGTSPGTLGTGTTVPGTGTTGPAATGSAAGSAGTASPCPPGTMAEGVGVTRRCRPLSGQSATDSSGIAAPSSIMAPPAVSGAR